MFSFLFFCLFSFHQASPFNCFISPLLRPRQKCPLFPLPKIVLPPPFRTPPNNSVFFCLTECFFSAFHHSLPFTLLPPPLCCLLSFCDAVRIFFFGQHPPAGFPLFFLFSFLPVGVPPTISCVLSPFFSAPIVRPLPFPPSPIIVAVFVPNPQKKQKLNPAPLVREYSSTWITFRAEPGLFSRPSFLFDFSIPRETFNYKGR